MFWLFKKLFSIAVLAAVVFFALQFQVGGHPVKKYLIDFYHSPGIGKIFEQVKETVTAFLQKDVVRSEGLEEDMDKVPEEDRKELEKLLQKEVHKK